MTRNTLAAGLLLAIASYANAQYGPPGSSGGDNPYSSGSNPYSSGSNGNAGGFGGFGSLLNLNTMVTAHAILATIAFGLLLPSGAILIRLASFRGAWLVHGIFQIIAYLFYIAAFAMGLYMATHARMMHEAHPIIGIIVFVLLFFQPFLGFIHHFAFKKYSKRVVWSYGHVWLGRIVITLGIINGGLGLQLAKKTRMFPPMQSTVIAYSVVAGVIWLIYVASAIYGERKRGRSQLAAAGKSPPPNKQERGGDGVQYA